MLRITKSGSYLNLALIFFSAVIAAVVSIRPLTYSVGDFLVYLKGATQILEGQDVYGIDFAAFGTRFFNGPVWGYLLTPFTMIPQEAALFTFRLISLAASILLFYFLVPRNRKYLIVSLSLVLLWFPSRMNINLAQGASIAAALGAYVAFRSANHQIKFGKLIAAALALTISINFKPTLLAYFMAYLLVKRKFQLVGLFVAINFALTVIQYLSNSTATYLNWFTLMLERNRRILEGDFSNIVGPWALIARIANADPKLIGYFSLLFSLFLMVFFLKTRKEVMNFHESLAILSIAVLIGPYSPPQDSFLLSLVLVIVLPQIIEKQLSRYLFVVISSCWSLSTEKSFLKSTLLILAITALVYFVFKSVHLAIFHCILSMSLLLANLWIEYDHITYDISGLGSLLGCIVLMLFLLNKDAALSDVTFSPKNLR